MTRRPVVPFALLFAIAIAAAGASAGLASSMTGAHPSHVAPIVRTQVSHTHEVGGRRHRRRQLARRSHHFLFWNHRNRYGTRQSGSGRGFSIGKWILAIVAIVIAVPIIGVILLVWFLRRLRGARR